MKALSIRQPWAWLIVHGYKSVENRSWSTKHRGRFLVHASSHLAKDFQRLQRRLSERLMVELPASYDTGGIVGEVELFDVVTEAGLQLYSKDRLFDSDRYWPWWIGPYGFLLRNPKPTPFRKCVGTTFFFTPKL